MDRVSFCASAQLRRLVVHTVSVATLCAAAAAHASDGLAISGSPPTTAMIGKSYSFTPTVSDPSKRTLIFKIWNKPSWLTFSASNGRLSGTPTAANVGTQTNITILVTDGVATVQLPAFAIKTGGGALAISGSPPTAATVGKSYSFTPALSDPAKVAVRFTIWNKPTWAAFSTGTGQLSGTPAAANVGTAANITILVTDGAETVELRPFSIKVTAATTSADVPVISGTPASSVTAGSTYKFQPSAKDPDGKTLSFSVQNKPAWATFSISSGLLDGKPTSSQTGTYGNIVISASNGQYSSTLPAFSVVVSKAAVTASTGAATVDWTPPTENTNGTKLTDLAGFRIYYGTSAGTLNQMVQVASTAQTSTTISNLAAGTWYFGGVAYTTAGTQSAMSKVVSATIQ
jgi:Putative Ig domain